MRCGRPRSFDNDLDRKLYLPYLTRDGDLAVASGEELPWAQMKFERRAHYAGVSGRSEIRTIDEKASPFMDQYDGEKVGSGKKSGVERHPDCTKSAVAGT